MYNVFSLLIALFLAFFTWLVLSYFELIAGEKSTNFEKSLDATILQSCRDNDYDIYFNFFWIFACIYALSKITELTERYISERLQVKAERDAISSINTEWENTLRIYEEDKQRLSDQINTLRHKNSKLEKILKDIKAYNMALIDENYRRTIENQRQLNGLSKIVNKTDHMMPKQQTPSNIFITNRHIHLTRQVFVNEGSINLNLRTSGGQEDIFAEPAQVWIKYLQMRKYYIGPYADPGLAMCSAGTKEPLVLTTEQLQKLQGIGIA